MDEPPENDPAVWGSMQTYERERRRHQLWLERSGSWNGIAGVWEAVKVLGHGGYGLCGLFKNKTNNPRYPAFIVVKQSGSPDRALRNESRLLRALGMSGSSHIVKLYKSYHREGGTGTSKTFDPHPYTDLPGMGEIYTVEKEISRIYLEFCSRGDLSKWMAYLRNGNRTLREIHLWKILECLAKGALVLEQGHEGDYDPQYLHRPVAHFDIKPNNILVGAQDNEHQELGVFKFADFGLSRLIPYMQSPDWIQYASWRYTTGFGTPEQVYPYHDNRYIGTPCNIWGIGALMYALTMPDPFIPQEIFIFHFSDGSNRLPMRTMGHPMLDNDICIYSRFFRQTVFTCLAFNPAQRPSPRDILALCEEAFTALAVDPMGQTLPPAFYTTEEANRLPLRQGIVDQPALPPQYLGETYVLHGPEIDELNFGPGLSPELKRFMAPIWPQVPPSPEQQHFNLEGQHQRVPGVVTVMGPGGEPGILHAGFDNPPASAGNPQQESNQEMGDADPDADGDEDMDIYP